LTPKSRKEAKIAGLRHFFTGRPCKNGHIANRFTANGVCVVCNNEYRTIAYNRHKEYYARYSAEFNSRMKALDPEYHERYYAANRDKILEKDKKWRKDNPEKSRALVRNRRSRIKKCDGRHTGQDVIDILHSQNFLCNACGIDISKKYHVDHIIPIAKGGSNWPSNLQCLCVDCNLRKGSKIGWKSK